MIIYLIILVLIVLIVLLLISIKESYLSDYISYSSPLLKEKKIGVVSVDPDCSLPSGGYHYTMYTCTNGSGTSAQGRCTTPDPSNTKEPC